MQTGESVKIDRQQATGLLMLAQGMLETHLTPDGLKLPTFMRWEPAGSYRRGKPECHDLEAVVIPAYWLGINLLWRQLDHLVDTGEAIRALKKAKTTGKLTERWGEKYRCFMLTQFPGTHIELYLANYSNWGPQLAIRTGPWEFSKQLMTDVKRNGYQQEEGYLTIDGKPFDVPAEADYFEHAGRPWLDPSKRFGPSDREEPGALFGG